MRVQRAEESGGRRADVAAVELELEMEHEHEHEHEQEQELELELEPAPAILHGTTGRIGSRCYRQGMKVKVTDKGTEGEIEAQKRGEVIEIASVEKASRRRTAIRF
ncbi:hypothetical protein SRHO_G00314720 [Serrasalmus rhombeus]